MKINFDKQKQAYKNKQDFESKAYEALLEKVLNENDLSLHTMLMKSDFENYLLTNKTLIEDMLKDQPADLSDFQKYEKELQVGNKKS